MMNHNSVLIDLYKNNHFKPSTITDNIINKKFLYSSNCFSVFMFIIMLWCQLKENNNYSFINKQ